MDSMVMNSGGAASGGVPPWWDDARKGTRKSEKRFAKWFDALSTTLQDRPLGHLLAADLEKLADCTPLNFGRVALALLFVHLKTAQLRMQDSGFVQITRALLDDESAVDVRVDALVRVATALSADFYQRLPGDKREHPGLADQSRCLARHQILPWEADWPEGLDARWQYLETYVRSYHEAFEGGVRDPDKCWHAAYAALALARSAKLHPGEAARLQSAVPDHAWLDVLAMLCLAAIRFQLALTQTGLQPKQPLPCMDFVDVRMARTMPGPRASQPVEYRREPVPLAQVDDTLQPALVIEVEPKPPDIAAEGSSPVPSTARRGLAHRAWLGLACLLLTGGIVVGVRQNVALRPTVALMSRCKSLQQATHGPRLIDTRLAGHGGQVLSLDHLAEALEGKGEAPGRLLVIAATGMGKTTMAKIVAARVCENLPNTFLLQPGNLSAQELAGHDRSAPAAWLRWASTGDESAAADTDAWLDGHTPRIIIDGLDEVHGASRDAFTRSIARVQRRWPDLRLLVFAREAQGLELGGANYDEQLIVPRLDVQESHKAVAQLVGSAAGAAAFFATAGRYGLTRTRSMAGRDEYRFLSTFDDIRAAVSVVRDSTIGQLRDRREIFEAWLELRLPKVLSAGSAERRTIWSWLDGVVQMNLSDPASGRGTRAGLLAACNRAPRAAQLPDDACARLFSAEALLDDGDGLAEHTVIALLTARGIAANLHGTSTCESIAGLDQDAAAFLLGHPAAKPCAGEIIRAICRASGEDSHRALAVVDTGLSFDVGERSSWLNTLSAYLAALPAGDPCPRSVVTLLRDMSGSGVTVGLAE
jgi:hypothetical protein